jgi:hypothetical protein
MMLRGLLRQMSRKLRFQMIDDTRGTGAARPQGNPDWAVEFHALESSAVHGALFHQLPGPVAASTIELARGDAPLRTDTDLKLWIDLLVPMILRRVFGCLRLRQQSISFS